MASTVLNKEEQKLLVMIPIERWVTSSDLIKQHYGKKVPFNGRQSIVARVNRIISKLETFGGDWQVVKTGRSGPHPILYMRKRVSS